MGGGGGREGGGERGRRRGVRGGCGGVKNFGDRSRETDQSDTREAQVKSKTRSVRRKV